MYNVKICHKSIIISIRNSFSEKSSWCRNEQVCQGVKFKAVWGSNGPDISLYVVVVVVVRLEHSHSFIDSLDNHSTAPGPAWCRHCRPPGNAVSGHSSTMCLVVWWLSPQGQAGDVITPHRWRDSAHLAWPHLKRFSVTNWRLGRVNPGCGHVGSVTRSCPCGTP